MASVPVWCWRWCVGATAVASESSSLSYLITTFPVAAVVMAGTAPFALFEQHPAAAAFDTHPSVETRVGYGVGVGGGAAATGAPAGDWSGPMLPFEVRNAVLSSNGTKLFRAPFSLPNFAGHFLSSFSLVISARLFHSPISLSTSALHFRSPPYLFIFAHFFAHRSRSPFSRTIFFSPLSPCAFNHHARSPFSLTILAHHFRSAFLLRPSRTVWTLGDRSFRRAYACASWRSPCLCALAPSSPPCWWRF